MRALLLLIALCSVLTARAEPVTVQPNDIVGDWISVKRFPRGQRVLRFSANSTYRGSYVGLKEWGRWALIDGNRLIVTLDQELGSPAAPGSQPKREVILVTGIERHADRTFLYVRLPDTTHDKWMK